MPYTVILLLLGETPSCCSCIVNQMLDLVSERLRFHPQSKVKFPNDAKETQFAALIEYQEPLDNDMIGFIDGVSFARECTHD